MIARKSNSIDKLSNQTNLSDQTREYELLRIELNSLAEDYSKLSYEHKELRQEYDLLNFIQKSSITFEEYNELQTEYKNLERKYNALVAGLINDPILEL